ncbi:MAG: 4a-hydroxytetrahydrobiopterin dehydratase [Patescibacteria group bacterium]
MGKQNLYKVSTETDIQDFLVDNKDWSYSEDKLKANFELPSFVAAVAAINKIFAVSAQMDHHPRVTNIYNRLELSLCTHSVGNKVTSYDIELAKEISRAVTLGAD